MKVFWKYCVVIALIVVPSLIIFKGCSCDVQNTDDVFCVGMECSYAPFNWTQPNDSHGAVEISPGWYASGYDVYIAKFIAENIGKKLKILKIDWDGLYPALTSGKIDVIIAGMSATENRKQSMDFSDNYYDSNIVIVVKKDGDYANAKSLEDFAGARITGQLSTVHYDFIDQIKGVKKCVAMEDFSVMVSALSAGKIDGYVSERPAAMIATHTNPALKYIEFEKGKGFNYSQDEVSIAIGVRKGDNELRNSINKALSKIDAETRKSLMEKAVKYQPAAAQD